MDCVSPILDVVTRVWNCTAKHAVYIRDLQENMESLRNAMQELKNVYEDVKGRVELEEQRQMKRTNEVDGWFHSVLAMELEVNEILEKGDHEIQKKCPETCCPRNCRSSYKLGKKASKKLGAVTELRSKGRFDVVADGLPQAPVDERPMEKTVGLDLMFTEVCRCIQDEELGIIGLYGMGGAGKTTIMTKINNEYFKTCNDFEVAIWVVVSRPASVEKVQEVIRNKLDIPDNRWRNRTEDEKAIAIFNVLKAKRFVMLLDDVWERLDLQKVGVPYPNSQNKSKVILTTRSLDVCRDMEAQKSIKVECLTEEEAINLFKEKVGETTLNSHPDIPQFAEIAAKECKGLPLALITIGRAMVGKSTPQEWERAIQMLKTYPSKFSGLGDHVFPILKFSYDNLKNDTIKSCFLYLAIFQEDYEIMNDDLINLWIGEGFFDEFDNIHEAQNQGRNIIEHLKVVCLFESVKDNQVKMHDVIRDMALWLASEYSGNKNKILVVEDDTLEAHQVSNWQETQQISLWSNSMKYLMVPTTYPNLLTFVVKNVKVDPSGFFHLMLPAIKVLDLSHTSISRLPDGFGKLVTLQYLNLSKTNLSQLSMELKSLTSLRCLLLDWMACLKIIPKEVVLNLSSLKLFSLRRVHEWKEEEAHYSFNLEDANDSWENNKVDFDNKAFFEELKAYYLSKDCHALFEELEAKDYDYKPRYLWEDENRALLEEMESLVHINEVSFPIEGAPSFQILLSSQKLQNAMKWLTLGNLECVALLHLPRMKHLQTLEIRICRDLEEIKVDPTQERRRGFVVDYIPGSNFHSLCNIIIYQLPNLLNLTWLIYIPSVEVLEVTDCYSMKEVIRDETGVSQNLSIFSRLRVLKLDYLPNLKSICGRALPFTSLTDLSVEHCPFLRKLPLDSNSDTYSLKTIKGRRWWWDRLQWENETIKNTFNHYFQD
ncbi:probable disease resistance protein At1g61310 [Vitis vinifera]|uniref:Uncharacterized protein n=1 Tax=Vitis vinifera TaxID=29760 RepID=F6HYC0_VITVI|nr:probable disease resistance protein At1g61310 [Vitis vinifera]XP_059595474.1 probable disease resistance protein At1g61310 [Vitis vinifera]|eukprot:XP_002278659.1 PREDICTED: probable disease resistance protein At1g61310 [Vitis vinifera]